MNKNTKFLLGGIAVVGAYLVYKYLRGGEPTIGNSTKASDTVKGAEDTTGTRYIYPLKKGSKGDMVKQLQNALGGKKNLPKFGADGQFGIETEVAVQKYLGKKTVDNFEDILKIANLNNLAYDPKTKKFATPRGGVTTRVSDIVGINK